MFHPPGDCPACGGPVRPKARACPHCGADERSGWQEDSDFDYGAFLQEEFGTSPKPRGLHPAWWIAGVILLGAALVSLLQGF